jgi:predicted phosphodiesterase
MRIDATSTIAIVLGILVLCGTTGAVRIVAGPYLQEPSDTSMTVMWIADQDCTSWVEYGLDRGLRQRAHRSRHGLIDACQTVHKVKIQGLLPGTPYLYRVRSKEILDFDDEDVAFGDTVASETFTFTTLNRDKEAFSFVVLNDTHEKTNILESLLTMADDKPYDLLFLNGDILVTIEDQQQIIDRVLAPCTEFFASHTPFIFVRGNHEARGRFARRLPDYVGMPNDRYYYAIDHGPVRFIVLDGGENKADDADDYAGLADFDPYRERQRQWLLQELQSDAFWRAAFRVVVVHIPPTPSQWGHASGDMYDKWMPLLNEGQVDLMICGHTHSYTISEPQEGVRDFPMVIGGGPTSGKATLIRVDVTPSTLDLTMTRDDGKIVGTYCIRK